MSGIDYPEVPATTGRTRPLERTLACLDHRGRARLRWWSTSTFQLTDPRFYV